MVIYYIKNKKSGKFYIGQTSHYKRRMREHLNDSKNNHSKMAIHKAIRKYGWESFEKGVLEKDVESQEIMDEMETHYIIQYDSYYNGYNSTYGGGRRGGFTITEEHKRKVSESLKGVVKHCKKWKIIHPNKKVEYIENLLDFCRKHNLHNGHMCEVADGKRQQHKGFICEQIGKERIENKKYVLISPDGIQYKINNITKFCEENNLKNYCIYRMIGGYQKTHRGWKARKNE